VKKEFSIAEFLVNRRMNSSGNSSFIERCSSAFAATGWPCWVSVKEHFAGNYMLQIAADRRK
jgi:hypothetical protein